jgi:hypothetical protein
VIVFSSIAAFFGKLWVRRRLLVQAGVTMNTVGTITRGTADGSLLAVRIGQSRHASLVVHGKPLGGAFNSWHPAELLQERILAGNNGLEDVLWRRNLCHGIVLVNPSRRTQHIKLGGTFRKIRGRTDPATNDGSELSSISLGAQRGIILLHPLP